MKGHNVWDFHSSMDLIASLRGKHSDAILSDNVVGVRVGWPEGEPRLLVTVLDAGHPEVKLLPQSFGPKTSPLMLRVTEGSAGTFLKDSKLFKPLKPFIPKIVVKPQALAAAKVSAGQWCQHQDATQDGGTIGWNFATSDGRRFFVGNWHVLALENNNTPLDSKIRVMSGGVFIDGGSRLSYFEPVNQLQNSFDLAIARYDQTLAVPVQFRSCPFNVKQPYPMKLASTADMAASYKVVGAMSQCKAGKLIGWGDHLVGGRWFSGQLFFESTDGSGFPLTQAGDSGSVMSKVEVSGATIDPEVVGLNFGVVNSGNVVQTISNPLFLKGWQTIGTTTSGGVQIPVLDVNVTLK